MLYAGHELFFATKSLKIPFMMFIYFLTLIIYMLAVTSFLTSAQYETLAGTCILSASYCCLSRP